MKRLLFVVLLLAGALAAPAGPAGAAACSGSSGVTVLVQFPDRTQVGCAPGDPVSGYQALARAGFTVTYATGNGTGAVCSINSYPDHACTSMPPQSAYWAYFHARPGGSWSYSSTGGGSYDPKPGTVEGWRFGDGAAPSVAPPGSAGTPTPKPSPSPTAHPVSRPTSAASNPVVKPVATGDPSGGSSTTAPDATSSASGRPTAAATKATPDAPSPAATDGTTSGDQGADAAGPVSAPGHDDTASSNHSWIWGVALVAVLAGAAAATAVRRRKA